MNNTFNPFLLGMALGLCFWLGVGHLTQEAKIKRLCEGTHSADTCFTLLNR